MEDLKILQKIYDMTKYGYGALAQFPKSEKFALVADIKHCMHQVLERAIEAQKKSNIKDKCWKLKNGQISADKLDATVGSYNGLMKHCNSYKLRCKLYEKYDLQQKGP